LSDCEIDSVLIDSRTQCLAKPIRSLTREYRSGVRTEVNSIIKKKQIIFDN